MNNIWKQLWNQGVRGVRIEWSAGGDDGSVESFEVIPADRKVDKQLKETLEEMAWIVYTDDFNGGTAGEFSCFGHLDIMIQEDGYKASAVNSYSEDQYDEETEEYMNGPEDTTTIADVTLN